MKKLLILFLSMIISVGMASASTMKFIQVDSVKFNPYDENSIKSFENIVNSINSQKDISFVIFSGDNISKSRPECLEGFLKIAKRVNAPVYIALGNKDLNKKKGLSKEAYLKTFNKKMHFQMKLKSPSYEFTKNGIVFIVVDASKEFLSTSNGYFREDTLKWLDKRLKKNKNRNVVILQHFPVVPPAFKDGYATYKAEDYQALLKDKTNVKAIFSGLYNMNSEQKLEGILYVSTANAPKYRVVEIIDCETKNPVFWSTVRE